MTTLSENDVREIARQVIDGVADRLVRNTATQIALHQANCPTGGKLRDIRATGRGLVLGVAGVCSLLGWLIPQVIAWLK